MRDYAKLGPTFWTGETGKALRRRGSEAVISALYLFSSPHSNMLGLYYQPIAYMGHETGLGEEGARKGLRHCIDVGLCSYDDDTEMVFVHEMAAWQIADSLSSGDNRCKGIQKDYDALPNCPYLEAFFDRYREAFHLKRRRSNPVKKQEVEEGAYQGASEGGHQAPTKPGTGAGAGTGACSEAKASAADAAPALPGFAQAPAEAPLSAKDRVWLLGPPLLGDKPANRALLGKLAATYGDEVLAAALADATAQDPPLLEPKAWLTAACAQRAKESPRVPQKGEQVDLLADPKPAWAIAAGFANRFEAENEGCTERNAQHFRGGRDTRKAVRNGEAA